MMKKLILSLIFLIPAGSQAASVVIEVDTGTVSVNALEATVILPTGVEVESIRTGRSSILFWIEEPKYDEASRGIRFAGTTPGGFSGRREIFTITGTFTEERIQGIRFTGVNALRNDGIGSAVPVKLRAIAGDTEDDVIPPDSIYIEVGKSGDLFGGRTFLSFVSQDKNSGIERYEVAEKFIGKPMEGDWREAKSPYEAEDQLLLKKVFVKAIDKDGNERVGTIGLPYRGYLMWFVAILIVVLCIIYVRRSRA
jgi:hypothetical protein